MKEGAERRAWVYAVAGFVSGIVVSTWLRPVWAWPIPGLIGVPELLLVFGPLVGLTFWVVLIVAIVRGLGMLRGDRYRRLEDLPADFDDWHRRAHAQMMREAASADDSGRRG